MLVFEWRAEQWAVVVSLQFDDEIYELVFM